MPYPFDKEKLPRELSFPLKRSVLDSFLAPGSIVDELHHVYFSRPQRSGLIVRTQYCGEDQRGWYAAGKSALWVFAVPLPERKQIALKGMHHALARKHPVRACRSIPR